MRIICLTYFKVSKFNAQGEKYRKLSPLRILNLQGYEFLKAFNFSMSSGTTSKASPTTP